MIAAPRLTLRSLPQRSVRAADVVEAASSRAPMPNVTAASPAVPTPKSSSIHAPNVTNTDCDAAISPNMPTSAAHPLGRSRRPTPAAARSRWGAGTPASSRATQQPGGGDTPTAPSTYDHRHDVTAATSPSVVTPIRRPSAHDVSMIPMIRPRRSYGTWSAVHEISPTSNTILDSASSERARA